jgi:SNF2 family DNA or RNA helicase
MNGQCSNCRQKLSMLDIIYMNSEFNLESITKDRMDDFSKPKEAGDAKAYKKPRAKIDAILDIIRGATPEEQKEVDVRVHNLMKGLGALPDGAAQKVLIFASFDETLKQIEKDLTENDIKFMRLGGSHSEITKTAEAFNSAKGSRVMIINSTKHCSGLNLQTATDLIFAHKIIDKDIQSQVAGRIQRMGRTTQARIHFMLYKNEFDWMTMQNELRVISASQ